MASSSSRSTGQGAQRAGAARAGKPRSSAARPPARRSIRRPPAKNRKLPVQIKWLRLGALALILMAGALYVSPLRAFFAQQDRYVDQVAALEHARADNAALKAQVAKLKTTEYVLERAREDLQLVPPGWQGFVVTGLPGAEPVTPTDALAPPKTSLSLGGRLADLWHTLLN
jgi:cell division protein FtsB